MHGSGIRLYVLIMVISAFFSAIVDQVTAILFLSAISLELASLYDIDPEPLILSTLYAIIIGGTATVIGDPVSLIIAFEGGLSMQDFLRWATPITLASLGILIGYILIVFWGEIKNLTRNMKEKYIGEIMKILTSVEVKNQFFSSMILIIILALIASHASIAYLLDRYLNIHINPTTTLLIAPLLVSSIVLIKDPETGRRIVTRRVDWDTLLFFVFFFTIVGSLDKTGLLKILSDMLISVASSSPILIYFVITISTGILSVFIPNVMTVATLAPIIRILASKGVYIFPTWWGLLFSSVFMGLSTPVGTTASLVLLGLLDKRRIKRISSNTWMKIGLPIAVVTTSFAIGVIFLEFF
jgi:Na+/H+ antiporter NhaD/arsenite permease-like protein